MVGEHKTLCQDCWEEACFITAPFCKSCGLPFEYDVPDGALCLNCARLRPPFVAARAVFPYDDLSRDLILAFKHGDRCDLAPTFAGWMVRSAQDLLEKSDLITPVPLHWRRLSKRRYNQAALLAYEMANITGLPYHPQLLKRTRHTPSQGTLSKTARQKNLQGAIKVTEEIKGQTILLVDDVLTTGATILACTQQLLRAGAKEVRVITIARVIQT
ncbi:ComF family protein [Terasakiella sp. SH-1]|uniref:ComF family protein n=1 Tax=Terasakiella sp. SH-1 TaxID=2560057 RepID=UPI001F1133F6|nr:ComF family protein [Terasakiella sp. SH-1]